MEVEEEEVMAGEDQFGLTSINIDIFLSQFNKDDGSSALNITGNKAVPIFFSCNFSEYFVWLGFIISGFTEDH